MKKIGKRQAKSIKIKKPYFKELNLWDFLKKSKVA